MQVKFIINKALTIPPHIFMRKVYFVLIRKLKHIIRKRKDFIFSTHENNKLDINYSHIKIDGLDIENNQINLFITKSYLEHKFDLLGSGWVENSYISEAFGLEKYKYNQNKKFDIDNLINSINITKSKEIYSLVDKDYTPIDWQKDFKSGFRWSTKDWYLNQRNSIIGVDIKVPWEMGRLQHLPQLAIFAINSDSQAKIIREFRNQILDFIALNPPRFGVQWTCTMDVGIRVANMILAYDVFSKIDENDILDKKFRNTFSKSIYEHGKHIINNLEYNENLTSNHYLSNIVGLLFVASYLECNDEVNRWLGFSIQEIINEFDKQFYKDGSNFEASTSYHRLSLELVVYATALILGLNKQKIESLKNYEISKWKLLPKLKGINNQEYKIEQGKIILPQWYINRLYRAGKFTYDVSKSNGDIVQIGDNDSGRFFRLSPNGKLLKIDEAIKKYKNLENYKSDNEFYWDENILNHQTILSALGGLFDDYVFGTKFSIEKEIIKSLANDRTLKYENRYISIEVDKTAKFKKLQYKTTKIFEFKDVNLLNDLKLIFYKQSGIYIFKSKQLYLLVSAGSNGQKGNGGHAHNDKLSFELNIDGKDIVVDAGTYLYTPLQDKRNLFRSTKIHNTLIVDNEEQNQWLSGRYGLFSMKNQSRCYLLDFKDNLLDVAVEYRGILQRRKFMITNNEIKIENYSNKKFIENYNNLKLYSNGYGKLQYEK